MKDILRPLRPSQLDVDRPTPQSPTSRQGPAVATGLLKKRATCSQCRVRKVRCDGREGLCNNCDRLGFECSFQHVPGRAPGQYNVRLPERRRRMQACIPCHAKKTRCLGELPRCSNCVRKSRSCVYPAATRKQTGHGQSSRHGTAQAGTRSSSRDQYDIDEVETVESTSLDSEIVAELVEDYFRHLYPLPSFAFLHQPTVIQRCRDQTINEPLKLAICAITALQLQRATLCHDLWVQQAEQSILSQIGRPSIFHLQALLLIIRYRIESGEFPTAFMLAALAARTAVALRLNYERSELAPVAQEARRRLFWSLYLLDDFFCVGLREFELCPEETIHLQLPCGEDVFAAGEYCPTGLLRPPFTGPENVTTIGMIIRLTSARRKIMRLNRRVGLGEESASTIGDSIRRFERELAALRSSLGPGDQYSAANLASCKWQAQYMMLHTSYHQCHCDLYRMLLNGYSEAAPSAVFAGIPRRDRISMQQRCLEHAGDTIRILSDFSDHGDGTIILERDTAVCAFESARLVMFGARIPGAASPLEIAIHKAKMCLNIITKFFPYSASTRPLHKDLDRLLQSYSVRLALQSQEPLATEPDPPSPRLSPKVSQYASSRQRLSVQSLLLQSDFVDDSHEIAAPSPRTTDRRESRLGGLPDSTGTPGVWGGGGGAAFSSAPNIVAAPSSTPSQPAVTATAIDACQEDAGLIFNPWMGFTGNEDLYGVSGGGPNEDY
ncbi:fungal-specific transcription factor domain-containing protein [Xylariaceae sp. FL0016]|nr:fungal-specific transcription factor domain-containing protein [Xylariaceae sp. FL0016]